MRTKKELSAEAIAAMKEKREAYKNNLKCKPVPFLVDKIIDLEDEISRLKIHLSEKTKDLRNLAKVYDKYISKEN